MLRLEVTLCRILRYVFVCIFVGDFAGCDCTWVVVGFLGLMFVRICW